VAEPLRGQRGGRGGIDERGGGLRGARLIGGVVDQGQPLIDRIALGQRGDQDLGGGVVGRRALGQPCPGGGHGEERDRHHEQPVRANRAQVGTQRAFLALLRRRTE